MQIYIFVKGEQKGPYSLKEIRSLIGSGEAVTTDMYWHEGCDDWKPIFELPISELPRVVANEEGLNKRSAVLLRSLAYFGLLAAILWGGYEYCKNVERSADEGFNIIKKYAGKTEALAESKKSAGNAPITTDRVDAVRNGILEKDDSRTVGDVLEKTGIFENVHWRVYEEFGAEIVEFQGDIKDPDKLWREFFKKAENEVKNAPLVHSQSWRL